MAHYHGELVSKDDNLQVQRRAGANEKAQRVKQRDDDRHHESRLSENVRNLNRHNVYGVFNRHKWVARRIASGMELVAKTAREARRGSFDKN